MSRPGGDTLATGCVGAANGADSARLPGRSMDSPTLPPSSAPVRAAPGGDCGSVPAGQASPAGSPRQDLDARRTGRAGVAYGLAAYLFWGLVPVYFKAIASVPPFEVLAHRILWSVPLLVILLARRRDRGAALAALRSRRTLMTLALTTVLVAANWLTFIWAVSHNQLMAASLGYFINPLLNVALGFVFLHERLRPWQYGAVLLAAVGVAYTTVVRGQLPLVALALAASFGLYGLLRKTARVDALVGLTVETALLWPASLVYVFVLSVGDRSPFGRSVSLTLLLLAAGVITAVPLLWFTHAARRLRLATLGFMQYLAPSGQFLLAVAAYGEPFDGTHAVTFACIWSALAIYSLDAVRQAQRVNRLTPDIVAGRA